MRASLTALAVALLLIAILAGSGCGLKGDLYLPEDETPAANADAEEADEQSDQPGSLIP